MTALGIDIDLREDYLEEHFADDCKCEGHNETVPVSCSEVVTHVFKSCTEPVLVCLALAEYVSGSNKVHALCGDCFRPTPLCWSVVPV